jgi:hypothetical protein
MSEDLGPLAVALSKAQGEFGPITRDKTVTVQKKSGGSYTFAYAPLDQIMNTVRGPLRDNGLTLTQILDAEGLVTMLIHESGACLRGVTALPETSDVQAFGSAITYLRRYSVVSILGIATEEDDDGNRATGNTVQQRAPRGTEPRGMTREEATALADATEPVLEGPYAGSGEIRFNPKPPADGNMRDTPDGALLAFQFFAAPEQGEKEGRKIPQVFVHGPLAVDLMDTTGGDLKGLVCAVEGDLYRVPWKKDDKSMPPFQRLILKRIHANGWTLPVPTQTGPGLFDAEVEAELDGALR